MSVDVGWLLMDVDGRWLAVDGLLGPRPQLRLLVSSCLPIPSQQRTAMDALFYDIDNMLTHCGDHGRVIVFAFMRGASIFLRRLIEVSGDKDLSRLYIISLPFADSISRAGGVDELHAYKLQHGVDVSADAVVFMYWRAHSVVLVSPDYAGRSRVKS